MKHTRQWDRNKKIHTLTPVLLFTILSAIVLIGFVIYKKQVTKQNFITRIQNSPTPSIVFSPSAGSQEESISSMTQTVSLKKYIIRNFSNDDNFFEKEKYPAILTSLDDKSLERFSCSDEYFQVNTQYKSVKTQKALEDKKLVSYLQTITEKYSSSDETVKHFFPSIQYCDREADSTLFFYKVGPCGGGCGGIQHIARMSQVGAIEFDNEIRPNVEGVPYFGCSLLAIIKPEFLPKDFTPHPNVFLLCQGEGYASVERIDVYTNVFMTVKSCRYQLIEPYTKYQCWE